MIDNNALKITEEMIKIPSDTSAEFKETNLAKYIDRYFKNIGIQSELTDVFKGRSNIVATLKGKSNFKPLILCGHLDTVPPYTFKEAYIPKIMDGNLYGRGSVDMKGQLACMMEAMRIVKSENKLDCDIIFAGVIDEEEGSLGIIDLVEREICGGLAIIGEATNFGIGICHKGLEWIKITFIGKAVHSGKYSQGISAIEMAAKFIAKCEEQIRSTINSQNYPLLGKGVLNYGKIQGGSQPSTVAGECTLEIDRRWLPNESYENIMGEFYKIGEQIKTHFGGNVIIEVMDCSKMKNNFVHQPLNFDIKDPIIENVLKDALIKIDKEPIVTSFSAWTDGGILSNYGNTPCVIIGPGKIDSAHTDEEHISIIDLEKGVDLYINIIRNYNLYFQN